MASPELTKLSIENAPVQQTRGQQAIAAGRAARESGASASEARRAARDVSRGNVITPENLQPVPQVRVTPPATPTVTPQLQADLEVQTDEFTQNLTRERETAQTGQKTALQDYLDTLKGLSTPSQLEAQALADSGADTIGLELNDINDQIRREQLSNRRAQERILNAGGQSKAQAQAQIANLDRASLSKQADLAVIQQAVQGRYDSAKEIADRAVKARLEHQELLTAAAKFNYEENKEIFTKAEQREFETLLGDRERAIKSEADKLKQIQELAIQAMVDGAPTDIVSRMQKAGTVEEATSIGGSFIGALDREAQRASIRASNASAASSYATRRNSLITAAKSGDTQAIAELGFDPRSSTELGEYSNIIDTASLLVGAERGEQTRRAIASSIERGDFTTAYSQIANNVQSNLQGESASRFGSARTDIQVLAGLRDVIEEFEAAGGDTGFLKGNADQIARKFGQLATDPKFAALAVQMEREFQSYRQQMTGAAFGAGESADYEKVVPSATKSIELNLATIDGALNQLENRVVGTVEAYVPGSREIYDIATGNEKVIPTTNPETEPIGSIIEYGGVRYRKVGDDSYEPI